MGDFINFLGNNLADFWTYTGFANATGGHIAMIIIGLGFIYLAVAKEFEPMLLIPIGFGILIGNIPFNMDAGLKVGIYEEGSVLNILYQGVKIRCQISATGCYTRHKSERRRHSEERTNHYYIGSHENGKQYQCRQRR